MRGSRLWLIMGLITALAAAMVAAGCGSDDDESDSGGSSGGGDDLGLVTEGTLTVGLDTPYPPFAIGQPPDVSGYDVEIMNGIAEQLELDVEYIATGFGTIFRDTANGQFDTAAAASDIDEEREQVVDFTDPYYLTATALVVPEDSDIASVDDLGGAIVGVQDGTSQQEFAEEDTEAAEVRGFPDGTGPFAAMLTGQVEAVLSDQATGAQAVEDNEGMEVVEEIPTDIFLGFAVAPDNDALREAMNEALTTLKEDGTMEDLYMEYFGSEAPPEVLDSTNELLTDD